MRRSLVTRIADAIGRESWLLRATRPIYEAALNFMSAGRGIRWSINGIGCRIDARQRQRMARHYERSVAAFLGDHIRPGDTCVDVGANVGVYVIQMAAWSAPDGRVLAFEPNPMARTVLERHVRMNHLTDRVEVFGAAVGSTHRRATIFAAEADGMARLGAPNPLLAGRTSPIEIDMVSLDGALAERDLQPNWILVDVEGYEADVLAGARRVLTDTHPQPSLVVELHPSTWADVGTDRAAMEELLRSLGVHLRPLTGQTDPLAEHGVVVLEPESPCAS